MGFRERNRTWVCKGISWLAPLGLACNDPRALDAIDASTSHDLASSDGEPEVSVTPAVELSGDLRAHDPALIRSATDAWYVFSTGDPTVAAGNIQIRRSSDLREWAFAGTVFEEIPQWVRDAVPGVQNLWAPDVIEHEGQYFLYYSASTF